MTFSAKDLPNRFEFSEAQPRIYTMWEQQGCFDAESDSQKKPFCIVIPPPNVTGALHLGHALNNTLQDIQIRLRRMQGFEALWVPGTDHAGIATQAVVERRLREEENKTRHDIGRENLIARIWRWKDQYEARIIGQLKQMGCSCDWRRTRFTLDEVCARAVRFTFFDLFQKQLIYRGKKLVNWDTFLQTAVSDDEVFPETVKGSFWHCKYPVIDPQPGEPTHVVVATTRPETMLGDTAVAVHPDPGSAFDKVEAELNDRLTAAPAKEKAAIQTQLDDLQSRRETILADLELLRDMATAGRQVMLPLMEREIPLVCDQWAKPELGSGCVKITPAHDPNDYEVGKRCGLPMINILNPDGTLNAEAGAYAGLTIKQARQRVVADLDAAGLLEKVEDKEIELPHSDRSKTAIEPYLADQWFVKMETLAQSAMDAVVDGRVKILPERYGRSYLDWLGEKRDWPVSRQLWWGHQIPVWSQSCGEMAELQSLREQLIPLEAKFAEKLFVQIETRDENSKIRGAGDQSSIATVHVCLRDEEGDLGSELESLGFVREADVLDTWFSSALWTHSTLGWPSQTAELKKFYPGSVLITSRDIITLWVARMVLMGLNNVGDVPFREVFIHPKILDGYGETMSKSKGNGIDPLDVIEKFGADSLRFGMAHLTTETQDVRLPCQFECPHCETTIEQTKKNRELPRIECPSCKQAFSTQWASSERDAALPRGPVLSERFEVARNFMNKLWNASRFALINLEGYSSAPVGDHELEVEDRWMLSRLASVTKNVTDNLTHYHYADAARELYDFAWGDFCGFYVEILKARFQEESKRPAAQRLLAHALDTLLRLLHPIMPFITEEIWQMLGQIATERGLAKVVPAEANLIRANWPAHTSSHVDPAIESQFAIFQEVLGALREIRSRQNIPPKESVEFCVRCEAETAELLQPLESYFESMAKARSQGLGPDVIAPKTNATMTLRGIDVYVDLRDFIDVEAECQRLKKEKGRIAGMITGKEKKLCNEQFVDKAPADVVERERESLEQLKDQLKSIDEALSGLKCK